MRRRQAPAHPGHIKHVELPGAKRYALALAAVGQAQAQGEQVARLLARAEHLGLPWAGRGNAKGVMAHVLPAEAQIAVASSVMSMPTGHQAMQRPQPTQPERPYWSCQPPSLWVSHWR
jgi:hypothetical protein